MQNEFLPPGAEEVPLPEDYLPTDRKAVCAERRALRAIHRNLVDAAYEAEPPAESRRLPPPDNALPLSDNEEAADAAIRSGCRSLKEINKATGIGIPTLTRHTIPALKRKRDLLSRPYRYE